MSIGALFALYSTALNELAEAANVSILIDETRVPISSLTQGACEVLGIDPFYMACEGTMVLFVAEEDVERVLKSLRARPQHHRADWVGVVQPTDEDLGPEVRTRGLWGGERKMGSLLYEALLRIC